MNSKIIPFYCFIILFSFCQKKESKYTSSQVFRYNEHSNITSLDPAFAKDQRNIWAVHQLYNGLVQLNDSLRIEPDIAKRWNISKDGKTYTFTLRDDVYFHKHQLFGAKATRRVKAADFVYSFERLTTPEVASPGGWAMQHVNDFRALNDSVFQIQLKKTFPPFLGLLAMKYCAVVSKEAVTYFGDEYRANPIGTGPFQYKL